MDMLHSEADTTATGAAFAGGATNDIRSAYEDSWRTINVLPFVNRTASTRENEAARRMTHDPAAHDMHPQLHAMERRMVSWLHDAWRGPKQAEPHGVATIGAAEACMLAGLAHRLNWRQARERAGKDSSRPNLVTGGNVQIAWRKFMRQFGVEPRIVPLKEGSRRFTAEQLDKYVDENTIAVVAIAGQTFTGEDDDIAGLHDWLDAYEKHSGISVPMHLDGASGGFVNPFLYPGYQWDFSLSRVQSINASGHKFGLTPQGSGWVVFRDSTVFNENLRLQVQYLGGEMPSTARNTSALTVQCYQFLRLDFDGQTRVMTHTLRNAGRLRDMLAESGYFRIVQETQRIAPVAVTLDAGLAAADAFDPSADLLGERATSLSAYSLPPDVDDARSLRVAVRSHINSGTAMILARDIIGTCKFLEEHGAAAPSPRVAVKA